MQDVMVVYGILKARGDATPGPIRSQHKPLHFVTGDGLSALVAVAPRTDLTTMPREQLVAELLDHQAVLEEAMRGADIIPLRFGTRAGDEHEVRRMLSCGRWTFREALDRIRGQAEYEVAVWWPDLAPVIARAATDAEVQRLRERLAGTPASLDDKLALGRLVKSSVDRMRNEAADTVRRSLEELSAAVRVHPILNQSQVTTVSLLIPRAAADLLRQRVLALDLVLEGRLNFKLIGPLPPHSFCTLEVTRQDPARVERACQDLGLSDTVTSAQVQTAYRRLLALHHPDGQPGSPAAGRFAAIQDAYRTLSACMKHVPVDLREITRGPVFLIEETRRPDMPEWGAPAPATTRTPGGKTASVVGVA